MESQKEEIPRYRTTCRVVTLWDMKIVRKNECFKVLEFHANHIAESRNSYVITAECDIDSSMKRNLVEAYIHTFLTWTGNIGKF